ncbi:MAG TPA: hypothetical protein VFW45_13630 [Candidatus Polarisedimenticolia bacterium]|nr:hypothetical protein [Candidatus Polarisedimenticolia bacterium]
MKRKSSRKATPKAKKAAARKASPKKKAAPRKAAKAPAVVTPYTPPAAVSNPTGSGGESGWSSDFEGEEE